MAVIYGIYHKGQIIYVGSTGQPLEKRWRQHKTRMYKYPHMSLYKYMNQYNIQDFRIKRLASVPRGKSVKEYEQKFIHQYSITDNIFNNNRAFL